MNTTLQVGGAPGLAILATLSATRTENLLGDAESTASTLTSGYHRAFLVAGGVGGRSARAVRVWAGLVSHGETNTAHTLAVNDLLRLRDLALAPLRDSDDPGAAVVGGRAALREAGGLELVERGDHRRLVEAQRLGQLDLRLLVGHGRGQGTQYERGDTPNFLSAAVS